MTQNAVLWRNGPKKPMAAPIWYFKEHQAACKTAHPTAKQCDIMAILIREEWSKIKETDAAKPYLEKAAQDKARYEQELKTFHKAFHNGTVPTATNSNTAATTSVDSAQAEPVESATNSRINNLSISLANIQI
jgi:hypothetical protein